MVNVKIYNMGQGTKHTSKTSLLGEILQKVFTNKSFLVTADKLQTVLNSIVESMWWRPVVLTITDENLSTYLTHVEDNNPPYAYLTIPSNVGVLEVKTKSKLSLAGIKNATTRENGSKLKVIGNITLWGSLNFNFGEGRMSLYYYQYHPAAAGGTMEGFQDFIYWNEVWLCDGY